METRCAGRRGGDGADELAGEGIWVRLSGVAELEWLPASRSGVPTALEQTSTFVSDLQYERDR